MKGGSLSQVYTIKDANLKIDLSEIEAEVLCDVNNPLTGPNGAARVYARQRGADDEAIALLEAGSRHPEHLLSEYCGRAIEKIPGAGGMGAGTIAFLGASPRPGISTILDRTNFDGQLKGALPFPQKNASRIFTLRENSG
jgi:glycerate kinase